MLQRFNSVLLHARHYASWPAGPLSIRHFDFRFVDFNPGDLYYTHTHTHTRLTALFPGLPSCAGTRKVKPIWILLKQETVSGSGISWTICMSAPCSRQTTTPAPNHSVFVQAGCLSCRPTNSVKALKAKGSLLPGVKKGKVFPYSLPSVGPGADPGVQAVSPQVTWSESRHIPSSSLPLLSARSAFTFVALTRWRYL